MLEFIVVERDCFRILLSWFQWFSLSFRVWTQELPLPKQPPSNTPIIVLLQQAAFGDFGQVLRIDLEARSSIDSGTNRLIWVPPEDCLLTDDRWIVDDGFYNPLTDVSILGNGNKSAPLVSEAPQERDARL